MRDICSGRLDSGHMYQGVGLCNGCKRGSLLELWRRPGGAVVQVFWMEHPHDGAFEWSSTGPPSNVGDSLRASSSELSCGVHGTAQTLVSLQRMLTHGILSQCSACGMLCWSMWCLCFALLEILRNHRADYALHTMFTFRCYGCHMSQLN